MYIDMSHLTNEVNSDDQVLVLSSTYTASQTNTSVHRHVVIRKYNSVIHWNQFQQISNPTVPIRITVM